MDVSRPFLAARTCSLTGQKSLVSDGIRANQPLRGLKTRCALLSLIVLNARRALGQIEHTDRQILKIGEDLGCLYHVGIFSIHVAEIDRVACLRTVETAFLGERDAVI